MRVLGIDPSLTGTAWALVTSDEGLVGSGYLKTKTRGLERLRILSDKLSEQIFAVSPDLVVIEDYAYNASNQAHQIGELGGQYRLVIDDSGIPWSVIGTSQRAKFATGKGNAGKAAVVSSVSARSGLVFANDDEPDAFAMACMALAFYGHPHPMGKLPKNHLEKLSEVDWPALKEAA